MGGDWQTGRKGKATKKEGAMGHLNCNWSLRRCVWNKCPQKPNFCTVSEKKMCDQILQKAKYLKLLTMPLKNKQGQNLRRMKAWNKLSLGRLTGTRVEQNGKQVSDFSLGEIQQYCQLRTYGWWSWALKALCACSLVSLGVINSIEHLKRKTSS